MHESSPWAGAEWFSKHRGLWGKGFQLNAWYFQSDNRFLEMKHFWKGQLLLKLQKTWNQSRFLLYTRILWHITRELVQSSLYSTWLKHQMLSIFKAIIHTFSLHFGMYSVLTGEFDCVCGQIKTKCLPLLPTLPSGQNCCQIYVFILCSLSSADKSSLCVTLFYLYLLCIPCVFVPYNL